MTLVTLKETPLAKLHRESGARMVDFAGWNMPVQYKSIVAEHMTVRREVGLFDVSHMGEFVVSGLDAEAFLQYLVANDITKLKVNKALYTQLVNECGGTVDDLIVYRREADYLVVVNASNVEKDWHWFQLQARQFKHVKLVDESDRTALLALQGPKALPLITELVGDWVASMPTFGYARGTVGGVDLSFGRTGYTGEDGFELFVEHRAAVDVWQSLLKSGQSFGIQPCGLGARDTLRLEAALPLYGHELDDETSPLEAGLGWSVKLDSGDFIGRDRLIELKENGLLKQLICVIVEGKALPRQGYAVKANGIPIGAVTSGSQGIFIGEPIAMAYVPSEYALPGTDLAVEIRGEDVPARVVPRPFYKAASGKM
jgi:aminomethyltransferase